jgi:hypothetical protein
MATFAIEITVPPLIVLDVPEKVWTPLPAVNVVALLVKLPTKVGVIALVDSFQTPPELIVTSPVNVFPGFVALEKAIVPVTPVVPVTPNVKAPTVKVVPDPTVRFPPTVMFASVVAVQVPLIVQFAPIVVMLELSVFAAEPDMPILEYEVT